MRRLRKYRSLELDRLAVLSMCFDTWEVEQVCTDKRTCRDIFVCFYSFEGKNNRTGRQHQRTVATGKCFL